MRVMKRRALQMLVNDGIDFYMEQWGSVSTPTGQRLERIAGGQFLFSGSEISEAQAKKILRKQLEIKFDEACQGAMARGWINITFLKSKVKLRIIRESAMNRPAFYISERTK